MSESKLRMLRFEAKSLLERPLSPLGSILGWLLATVVFLGVTAWLGGPVEGDAALSIFSTWAIAHGHIACAYSSHGVNLLPSLAQPTSFIPPLYPMLSAGVLALAHSTYNVPFPTTAQLGSHCATSNVAIYHWALKSHAIMPTIRIGYVTWIALMAGTIALLRAAGRGRNLWEPVTLLLLAVIPPVSWCLTEYFHPQDILAMGIGLGGLACALRGRWGWAGILIGLAFTSNQFALLFAAPMFVIVPKKCRISFVTAAIAIVVIVSAPMIIVTSGDAIRGVVIGTGNSPARGGTFIWLTHLAGTFLFVFSRLLPVAGSMAFAWWAKRHLANDVLKPIPFLSIVATALALRLVFEFSLWGYFLLGVATMLVLIDVVSGRIRGETLTWLALATVIFNPFPWGFASNGQEWGLAAREWTPNVVLIVGLAIIVIDLARHHLHWYVVAAVTFVGVTFVTWPWLHEAVRVRPATWIVQLVLVPAALWLASTPLIGIVRNRGVWYSPQEVMSDAP